jgi:hypothetical protein
MYADAAAGHPGAIFLTTELTPHLFFNFFTSSQTEQPPSQSDGPALND